VLLIRLYAAKPCGEIRFDPKSLEQDIEHRNQAALLRMRGISPRKKEVNNMPLIQLLEVLIVVGVLLWLVNRFIPMQGTIKSILNGVVVIAVVLWLLNVFGLFHSLSHIRIGT
jgi:hypothetical protein